MNASMATPARFLLVLALCVFSVNDGFAVEYRCDNAIIGIVADHQDSVPLVCQGAARAVAFLRAQNIPIPQKIVVRVVEQLANEAAAGHLQVSSDTAVVLNYPAFLEFGEWLRVPIDAEIYRVLVAHEVAHVIAAHNFQIPKPTVQAHEYIAYVTTFSTLDAARREEVLEQFAGDGFETEQQMNTTIYLCDPFRFGAEAYRHFLKKGKEAGFLGLILSGHALAW